MTTEAATAVVKEIKFEVEKIIQNPKITIMTTG